MKREWCRACYYSPVESDTSKQILIVDDEPTARHLLRHVVQLGGYRLLVARDAVEAIKLLEAGERPDLVISDVMMPGLLGTDLVQYFAGSQHLRCVPVVLLSAYHDISQTGKTAAFVHKPYSPQALLGLIADLLAEDDPPANSTREPRVLSL